MNMIMRFTQDVMEMGYEVETLREEVARLRKIETKYNVLLNRSLEHSLNMSGQVLELCLNGGTFNPDRAK